MHEWWMNVVNTRLQGCLHDKDDGNESDDEGSNAEASVVLLVTRGVSRTPL
jgi:hypothetical protein